MADGPSGGDALDVGVQRVQPDVRFVAVGAATLAEAAFVRAARLTGDAAWSVSRQALPPKLWRVAERLAGDLDRRGRNTVAVGSVQAIRAVDAISAIVLPVVLSRVAAEPEQVQLILQRQSRTVAEELARTARRQAAGGDQAVDRFLTHLLHRRPERRAAAGAAAAGAPLVEH